MPIPCVVGTWPFSAKPAQKAWMSLQSKGCGLEAVEEGVNVAEEDPAYGRYHVGCGGWHNSAGVLELDAAIMDGETLRFGAITGLVGYSRAISVARQVMTHSKHSMLTGTGAAQFAAAQGFQHQERLGQTKVLQSQVKNFADTQERQKGHDTLGLLCVDQNENIYAGVSTSGAASKEPGRVGDSALPGCGLYADSEAGGACCSGDGDEIMKFCPSYRAVDNIKQGLSPQDACEKVMCDIVRRRGATDNFEMVIIAVDKQGRVGAANTGVTRYKDDVTGIDYQGFPYAVISGDENTPVIHCVPPFEFKKI